MDGGHCAVGAADEQRHRLVRVFRDNRLVNAAQRPLPPLNADERSTLEGWHDFHRATLALKCEGLDDKQAALASVPPSGFTLTGLVQHMAEVERNWFRGNASTAPQACSASSGPFGPAGAGR
jgi:hypothetical protein